MSEAEQELLSLYTQKAYEAYQSGNMKQTEHYAAKIARLQPGNGHSVFLRGAVTGRVARPGKEMQNIKAAIQIWIPLVESLEGETLELMKAAVDEAFSVITFIPVELSARKWDAYLNKQTAEELAEVLNSLMELDDFYSASADTRTAYSWIHSLFRKNYVFWIDEVLGINKPIPVGPDSAAVKAYYSVLSAIHKMAERMEIKCEADTVIRDRAFKALERYKKLNGASQELPARQKE